MTERNFGRSITTFIAEVADVNDPNQSGRVKVRVVGRHDDRVNIPDSALPWAQVLQPVTSAANGRMGTAPVGLTVGSRVVGIFIDADEQLPLILGSVGRAGDPILGQTVNGAPAVNTATGSIPASSQGVAANPYTSLYPGRVSISSVDSRLVSIQSVNRETGGALTTLAQANMINPRLPTTGSYDRKSTLDVLDIVNAVDPLSTLSSLPCLNTNLISLESILRFISSAINGIANLVAAAIRDALLRLAQKIGLFKLLGLLNAAVANIREIQNIINTLNIRVCGVNLINQGLFDKTNFVIASVIGELNNASGAIVGGLSNAIDLTTGAVRTGAGILTDSVNSGVKNLVESVTPVPAAAVATASSAKPNPSLVVTQPPNGYVQQYYTIQNDPFPGYIEWRDPTGSNPPTYTLRNGQPNYANAQQHTNFAAQDYFTDTIGTALLRGDRLDFNTLTQAVSRSSNFAQAFAVSKVLGSGYGTAQTIGVVAALIPTVAAGINTVYQTNIGQATYTSGSTATPTSNFMQSQALLATQRQRMRTGLFTPGT
jgi:hypothetical protein